MKREVGEGWGLGTPRAQYLSGKDLDFMLPGGQDSLNDGTADVASAACDCDDCHDEVG
jgi:hypothetical protein